MAKYTMYEVKVLMFLQNSKGEYLFTNNNHADSIIKDYINPPGGHIESGETISETVKREIDEEMGITEVENIKTVGTVNVFGFKDDPVLMIITSGTIPDGQTPVAKDEGEPVWVDMNGDHKYKMFDDVAKLSTAVEKGVVFSAKSKFEGRKMVEFILEEHK